MLFQVDHSNQRLKVTAARLKATGANIVGPHLGRETASELIEGRWGKFRTQGDPADSNSVRLRAFLLTTVFQRDAKATRHGYTHRHHL